MRKKKYETVKCLKSNKGKELKKEVNITIKLVVPMV